MNNKVVSLSQAVAEHIQPGMTLHISLQSGAATCELARQFRDADPNFTLIMNMIGGHHALGLIHKGLVRKLIFATCADIYPRPYPNPVIQRAFLQQSCELENWSMLSLILALMGGALNLSCMATRSLIGSSLAEDNRHSFQIFESPFPDGEQFGLVKSLRPDISMIHGWAADSQGNVLIPGPPRDAWAAKASQNGILVTVERLVSDDFIRQHSLLVKIPGHLVKAVSLAPLGAHPQNMNAQNFPEFAGYGLDKDYLRDFRKAAEDPESFEQWVQDWIYGCSSHETYLQGIGQDRIEALKAPGAAPPEPSQSRIEAIADAQATPAECAVISGARSIRDMVQARGYKSMFAGIGLSGLAGWCAYYFLKEMGYAISLIAAGIEYEPCPGDPLLISSANMATAKMISDSLDLHGVGAGGTGSRCLGVLGVGQIDRLGNINTTRIRTRKGSEIYLSGAGGGNDIASLAQEVVAVAVHRANRMVDAVEYVTCPGGRISTLATDEGVFEKRDSEFVLSGYFAKEGMDEQERMDRITRLCDWNLQPGGDLKAMPLPSAKELALLRSFDPDRVFLGPLP